MPLDSRLSKLSFSIAKECPDFLTGQFFSQNLLMVSFIRWLNLFQ
jgi:hypothetical protein